MKMMWCWRCRMEVPMLDKDEYKMACELYRLDYDKEVEYIPKVIRSTALLEYYNELTGWNETVPNAIMHHAIDMYGPPCGKCGKPYRTPNASFCAACGNKRML